MGELFLSLREVCTVCSWQDLAPIIKWGTLIGFGLVGMIWLAPAGIFGMILGRALGTAAGAGIWYGLEKLGVWDKVGSFTTLGQSESSSSSGEALQNFEETRRRYHPPLGPPP